MVKVVNIKGSNGSGKTTIVKQLIAISNEVKVVSWRDGHAYGTVMPDIGWAAVGQYKPDKPMGGCDLLKNNEQIMRAIYDLRDNFPTFHIVFESMFVSTIKSTYYDFLLELEKTDQIEPLFVILQASVDTCLRNIAARGTQKANLNVDNVAGKCMSIMRHAGEYDQQYVRYINVNFLPIDALLPRFLWEVRDNELIDAIYDQPTELPIRVIRG